MSEAPMRPEPQDQDEEHLQLLAIFHYVLAGLAGLFSLVPVLHLIIGLAILTGGLPSSDPGAAFMGWFFVVLATVWILFGAAYTVAVVMTARALTSRTRHTFCLVMAGVSCLFMPFGTVLGVFTILVLMRPSVKRSFGITPRPRADTV